MSAFEKKFGKDFLSTIPTTPGVYFFYCAEGKLLYVGKAKSLRKRLAQYRDAKKTRRHKKMRYLIENASRLEWEICESDLEASLKEARLIQKLRPPKNIAGAYSFLYPLVGIRSDEKCLYFCLTTLPEKFPNYTFHGCFRSRKVTGGAFFALMEILEYVGHPLSAKDLKSEGRAEYSYVFGFRQIESKWENLWKVFFKGESREALEELILCLIDKPGARKNAERVQETIKLLKKFFRLEAKPLATAIKTVAYTTYPVTQLERDPLFLSYKAK